MKLYATDRATTKNLAAHIDLTVSQGTSGLGDRAPTREADKTRTYRITCTVNSTVPDSTQGAQPPSASRSRPRAADHQHDPESLHLPQRALAP